MIDLYAELENKITAVVKKINSFDGLSYPIILSHQNGPEPKDSYLAVNCLDMDSVREVRSGKYEHFVDNGVEKVREHITTHYRALVQLTFIGPDAGAMASRRHSNMLGMLVIQEFNRLGLAPTNRSHLRKNPQPRGGKWVNDFAFDLTISYSVLSTVETTEWVEKFTLLGNSIQVTN